MANEQIQVTRVIDPSLKGASGYVVTGNNVVSRTFFAMSLHGLKKTSLELEITQLEIQAWNLKEAFALMQKHHNLEEIAKKVIKDRTLHERTLQVLNIFINDLFPLINRIKVYSNRLDTPAFAASLKVGQLKTAKEGQEELINTTQNIEAFTEEVKKLNAALKKACDTTILYDVSTGLLQELPNAYYLFILLGPLDVGVTVALALSATGVIGVPLSLFIHLAEVFFSISAIFPIIHGISALIKNTANPIDFKVEQLEALSKETCPMDDKFSTAFPDDNKRDENTNYGPAYKSLFLNTTFLKCYFLTTEPDTGVKTIQKYFSPTASPV
jgi:hypothetical protein